MSNIKLMLLILKINGRVGKTLKEIAKVWTNPSSKEIDIKMKLSVGAVTQTLLLAIQALNQVGDLVPVKWRVAVAVAISILQGIIGVLQHFSNPDGSPSKEPNQGVK